VTKTVTTHIVFILNHMLTLEVIEVPIEVSEETIVETSGTSITSGD